MPLCSITLEIAHQLTKGLIRSFGESKRLILSSVTEGLEAKMEKEIRMISSTADSTEGREGIAAFMEKCTPEVIG